MPKRNTNNVYVVILVGGKGKRLRPISTDSKPKAFIYITKKDETMFRKTLDRARKLVLPDHIIVVANRRHAGLVKKDFPLIDRENLILEPASRNTAPAVGLAASVLEKRSPGSIMVVLPADHYIKDESAYLETLRKAVRFIRRRRGIGPLIVFGVKPEYPATGFGYIKLKAESPPDRTGLACRRAGRKPIAGNIYEVERFVEKPDLLTAKEFLKDGRYLWNSGMFIFKTTSILEAIKKFIPEIHDGFRRLGKTRLDRIYEKLPDISVDYAVMEKSDNIYCVKGSFGWRDMGNFENFRDVLEKEFKGLAILARKTDKSAPLSMRILKKLRDILKNR